HSTSVRQAPGRNLYLIRPHRRHAPRAGSDVQVKLALPWRPAFEVFADYHDVARVTNAAQQSAAGIVKPSPCAATAKTAAARDTVGNAGRPRDNLPVSSLQIN